MRLFYFVYAMGITFEISLNMKTCRGMETYGCFQIGSDKQFAEGLFKSLEGSNEVSMESIIMIDLIAREKGVPYPIALKHCTIEELAGNVKLITKQLFRQVNLEG